MSAALRVSDWCWSGFKFPTAAGCTSTSLSFVIPQIDSVIRATEMMLAISHEVRRLCALLRVSVYCKQSKAQDTWICELCARQSDLPPDNSRTDGDGLDNGDSNTDEKLFELHTRLQTNKYDGRRKFIGHYDLKLPGMDVPGTQSRSGAANASGTKLAYMEGLASGDGRGSSLFHVAESDRGAKVGSVSPGRASAVAVGHVEEEYSFDVRRLM